MGGGRCTGKGCAAGRARALARRQRAPAHGGGGRVEVEDLAELGLAVEVEHLQVAHRLLPLEVVLQRRARDLAAHAVGGRLGRGGGGPRRRQRGLRLLEGDGVPVDRRRRRARRGAEGEGGEEHGEEQQAATAGEPLYRSEICKIASAAELRRICPAALALAR